MGTNAKIKETLAETASNKIIKMLDGLVREYIQKAAGDKSKDGGERDILGVTEEDVTTLHHREYGLELRKHRPRIDADEATGEECMKTIIEFVASRGRSSPPSTAF